MPARPRHPEGDAEGQPTPAGRAAEAVRQRRLELGWTQEQLAERSGVSPATVRKLEAAAQDHYRPLTCSRLCSALGWAASALDALLANPPSRPVGNAVRDADGAPPGAPTPGVPRQSELAALQGRLAQLDERKWERLMAFVDGLTSDG